MKHSIFLSNVDIKLAMEANRSEVILAGSFGGRAKAGVGYKLCANGGRANSLSR